MPPPEIRPERSTKRARGKVEIELRMPADVHRTLNFIVNNGILGATMDAVVEHILRQHLWEEHLKIAVHTAAAKEKVL